MWVRRHSNGDRGVVSPGAWEEGRVGPGKEGQHLATEAPVHSLTSVAPSLDSRV